MSLGSDTRTAGKISTVKVIITAWLYKRSARQGRIIRLPMLMGTLPIDTKGAKQYG
jgi:hypothetical protein